MEKEMSALEEIRNEQKKRLPEGWNKKSELEAVIRAELVSFRDPRLKHKALEVNLENLLKFNPECYDWAEEQFIKNQLEGKLGTWKVLVLTREEALSLIKIIKSSYVPICYLYYSW